MIEIWFADEARIGQKNKITRRWAKRGTRPSAPKDQRTASARWAPVAVPRMASRYIGIGGSAIGWSSPVMQN